MITNRAILDELFEKQQIKLRKSPLFERAVHPKDSSFDFGKVEGMLLGLAIGDALGITTEGLLPHERRLRHNEVRNYIPNRFVNKPIGFPSDDTQLAFWTLEQMIWDGGFVPDNVAKHLSSNRIFGIGSAVRGFLRQYKGGAPWYKCGSASAGNGALMRIAPMVVPHLSNGGSDIWIDTALSAMITHNDSASIAACLAFVGMLWDLLDMKRPPHKEWWLERYVDLARDLETESTYRPRGGKFLDYEGPLWKFCAEKVSLADSQGLSVEEAGNGWYSGAYLMETMPSVLMILMRYGDDPEEAIIRAVNDTKDNDSIAAIVGAAVGALHGKTALPERWIRNLSGRTTDCDDGRIFEILSEAKESFWHSTPQVADGEIVIRSRDYWLKVLGMLQQNWALIDTLPGGRAAIHFVHDFSGVFDRMEFADRKEAAAGLKRNGFYRYAEDETAHDLIVAPEPPFFSSQEIGPIYSSGKYWE